MFLCVYTPKLYITSGEIWPKYDWLNKLYNYYVVAVHVVDVASRHGLRNDYVVSYR